MTFKDVVWKNFVGSLRKYIIFFACSSFSVMVFFLYASLLFVDAFTKGSDEGVFQYVLPTSLAGVCLFTVFFILYSGRAFMRGRKKEFGVYMTLGMNAKQLAKMIAIENLIINLGSMLFGILAGAVFARLFQMGIVRVLQLDNIKGKLSPYTFLITIVYFLILFSIVYLSTAIKLRRTDIVSLLQESRKGEQKPYSKLDAVLGCVGIGLILFASVFLVIISKNEKLNSNILIISLYLLMIFTGIYLTISFGGNFILRIIKKSKFYLRNMLGVSGVEGKFNQTKKIMFITSNLIAMTLVFIAAPYSLLQITENITDLQRNSIDFMSTESWNEANESDIKGVLRESKAVDEVSALLVDINNEMIPVVSVESYNSRMEYNYSLSNNDFINIIWNWVPGNHGIEQGTTLDIKNYKKFKVVSSSHENFFTSQCFSSNSILLASQDTFNELNKLVSSNQIKGSSVTFYCAQYSNWKETQGVVDELHQLFGETETMLFSKIEYYQEYKNSYAAFLFIASAVGILFFISSISVLYFKMFTELDLDKIRFHKLYKLGITKREVSKTITVELAVVYFIPIIFGAILGIELIYMTTNIVGGKNVLHEFLNNTFCITGCIVVIQFILFIVSRKKYISEVYNEKR